MLRLDPINILVDEGGKVGRAYDIYEDDRYRRHVFVVDKSGVIRWNFKGRPETEQVLEALDALG